MPNYNIIVDTSNFKPFDITPRLQILRDYRDAYYRLEDLLDKIALEKGLYTLPDGDEYKPYKDVINLYNQDYADVVEDFSRGMNLRNRAAVMNIRRRYLEEVAPINRAAEAYNKYLDKVATLGPDAIMGNPATFKDFVGGLNPSLDYVSAKEIQNAAAGVTQGLDNALMKAPEVAGDIAKQYFVLKQSGLDGNQALLQIMQHNPTASTQYSGDIGQLVSALDKVYNTYAKDTYSSEANNKIWNNTIIGAIRGILAPKYDRVKDENFITTLLQEERLRKKDTDKYNLSVREANGYIKLEDGSYKYDSTKDQLRGNKPKSVKNHIEYGDKKYTWEINKITEDDGLSEKTVIHFFDEDGNMVRDATLNQQLEDIYFRRTSGGNKGEEGKKKNQSNEGFGNEAVKSDTIKVIQQ